MSFDDKWIRNHAFEPEILLERADTVQRDKYHQRRRRQRQKLLLRRQNAIRIPPISEEGSNDSQSTFEELEDVSPVEKEVEEFYFVSTAAVNVIGAMLTTCAVCSLTTYRRQILNLYKAATKKR